MVPEPSMVLLPIPLRLVRAETGCETTDECMPRWRGCSQAEAGVDERIRTRCAGRGRRARADATEQTRAMACGASEGASGAKASLWGIQE